MSSQSSYWFLIWLSVSASGCATFGAYSPLLCVEQAAIYHPTHALPGQPRAGAEEVWFTATDGVRLHGRFFACEQPKAIVLYCHGNAGSVESWTQAASELQERHQCAVFLFDYRGFGHSEGTPTEDGIYLDARAARQWLAARTGIQPSDVVLVGRSLGGGVAVELAAQDGARGLVLQSTFSSLPDVAASHLPWVFPHLMMTQRFDSIEKIKHYRGPLLQCHGSADELVPLESAKKLFNAASGAKYFITIPGANHNDPPNLAFEEELDRFLSDLGSGGGTLKTLP